MGADDTRAFDFFDGRGVSLFYILYTLKNLIASEGHEFYNNGEYEGAKYISTKHKYNYNLRICVYTGQNGFF